MLNKYNMIRQERSLDFSYIAQDPVRPELDMTFRNSNGREVYSFIYNHEVAAVICIAYVNTIPITLNELIEYSCEPADATIAIPYTVWSYKKGFGRSMVLDGIDSISEKYPSILKFVTLSPKTEMAYKFHTGNGAIHIASNHESDNYEYPQKILSK